MADNYLLFSECLEKLTPFEVNWLESVLEEMPDEDGDDCPQFLLDYADRDEGDNYTGFDWLIEEDNKDRHGEEAPGYQRLHYMLIYSEDHGDPERVALLVQKFLKACRPNDWWSMSFAQTCSKPRVGEFGGGAVFITADEIRWFYTSELISEAHKAFERIQALNVSRETHTNE